MKGTFGFDRQLTYAKDCTTLRWAVEKAEAVQIDGRDVGLQGTRPFCFDGDDPAAVFHVWVDGVERVYTFRPRILWRGRIPLFVFGAAGMVASGLILGFVLRLPPLMALAERTRNLLARRERAWTTAVVVWIVGSVFVYWLIRGSPGFVTAAERMDELRALLRSFFGGTF